jgi:rhamnosyltransferase
MTKSSVLILLSTYNGEKFLLEQLYCLINQKNVNLKILIRDDGSNDNTINILKDFHFNYKLFIEDIFYEQNIGFADSYRKLLLYSNHYSNFYDFYSFCDQDDIWLDDKICSAISLLNKFSNDTPNLYFSNLMIFNKDLRKSIVKYKYPPFYNKQSVLVENVASGCTIVFNRKTIQFFNDYTPQKFFFHDIWFFHICLFFGNVIYDHNSFIYYRQHDNNVLGTNKFIIYRIFKLFNTKNFNFITQNRRMLHANEFLCTHFNILNNSDKRLLILFSKYKSNINFKLELFFNFNYTHLKMSTFQNNIILKFRILFGLV